MSIQVTKHCKEYAVKSYEADCRGFLRITSLMNLLQDMACENADSLGFGFEDCAQQNLAWVGADYLLEISQLPRIDEHFIIETWPSGTKLWGGVRDFLLKDTAGNILVAATSLWVLIDVLHRRPVNLSKHFPQYTVLNEHSVTAEFAKLPPVEDPNYVQEFTVRFDDIDVNNHVNNAIYPLWATESVAPEFRRQHTPKTLEISFKKEALYGQQIKVCTKQTDTESLHTIYEKQSGTVLADCRIKWQAITSK